MFPWGCSFSSKTFIGDFFFIRYCLLSYYFVIFGERRAGGVFIESFSEVLLVLVVLLLPELLLFWPKLQDFYWNLRSHYQIL